MNGDRLFCCLAAALLVAFAANAGMVRTNIVGMPPWEWKGRAEENELLIGTLKGLGHKQAWYVRLPYANHGRTMTFGPGYVEGFVLGCYPDDLHLNANERQ